MTGCPVFLPPVSGSTVGDGARDEDRVGVDVELDAECELVDDELLNESVALPELPLEHAAAVNAKAANPAASARCRRCFIQVITGNATVSRMATPLAKLNADQGLRDAP